MTSIQEYLLKLLREIDQLCLDNNIDYRIFAGSMLGVERNEGFLPWDDDIDIVMTKKNYDRFKRLMESNPRPNRTFECIENNPEYPLQFGKYISTETAHITRSLAFENSSAGIWIDVMYVVPLPKEKKKLERIKRWFGVYCELENELYVEYANHEKGFYWRYKLGLLLIKIFGKKLIVGRLKKWFNSYSEDDCDSYLLYHGLGSDFREFDKKFFEKTVRRTYNNAEVSVSKYNRELCRAGYGDTWMLVPEQSEQQVHTVVLDFDISYKRYVEDYMVFLDRMTVSNDIKKAKQVRMKELHKWKPIVMMRQQLNSIALNLSLENRIEQESIDLQSLVKEKEFTKIELIYEEYLALQLSDLFMFWGIFIPIEDDVLFPVLYKITCSDGAYYTADKILKLRIKHGSKPISEDLQKLCLLIDACRSLSVAIWDKQDVNLVKDIVKNKKNIPFASDFCIDFKLAELYVLYVCANSEEEYKAVINEGYRLINNGSEKGECYKLVGDAEYQLGHQKEAQFAYEQAKELTNNGLILLDIKKQEERFIRGR